MFDHAREISNKLYCLKSNTLDFVTFADHYDYTCCASCIGSHGFHIFNGLLCWEPYAGGKKVVLIDPDKMLKI